MYQTHNVPSFCAESILKSTRMFFNYKQRESKWGGIGSFSFSGFLLEGGMEKEPLQVLYPLTSSLSPVSAVSVFHSLASTHGRFWAQSAFDRTMSFLICILQLQLDVIPSNNGEQGLHLPSQSIYQKSFCRAPLSWITNENTWWRHKHTFAVFQTQLVRQITLSDRP